MASYRRRTKKSISLNQKTWVGLGEARYGTATADSREKNDVRIVLKVEVKGRGGWKGCALGERVEDLEGARTRGEAVPAEQDTFDTLARDAT